MNKAGITLVIGLMLSCVLVKAQDTFTPAELMKLFTMKMDVVDSIVKLRSFKDIQDTRYEFKRILGYRKISRSQESDGDPVKRGLSLIDAWDPWKKDIIERFIGYNTTSFSENETILAWAERQPWKLDTSEGKAKVYTDGKKEYIFWQTKEPRSSAGFIWVYHFSIEDLPDDKKEKIK
jgi:hypothetical protein